MEARSIILSSAAATAAAVLVLSGAAQASRVILCSGRAGDDTLTASLLSNQGFGEIVQATLQAGTQTTRAVFSATDAPARGPLYKTQGGAITIPLDDGEKLVLSTDERSIAVLDRTGNFRAALGCEAQRGGLQQSPAPPPYSGPTVP